MLAWCTPSAVSAAEEEGGLIYVCNSPEATLRGAGLYESYLVASREAFDADIAALEQQLIIAQETDIPAKLLAYAIHSAETADYVSEFTRVVEHMGESCMVMNPVDVEVDGLYEDKSFNITDTFTGELSILAHATAWVDGSPYKVFTYVGEKTNDVVSDSGDK